MKNVVVDASPGCGIDLMFFRCCNYKSFMGKSREKDHTLKMLSPLSDRLNVTEKQKFMSVCIALLLLIEGLIQRLVLETGLCSSTSSLLEGCAFK